MSVGLSKTKADIDNKSGSTALSVRQTLDAVRIFKAFLDTIPDAELVALGYTTTEKDQLRSAYTDLDKLRQIYEGTQTQSPAYDFRTFAKLLTGVN